LACKAYDGFWRIADFCFRPRRAIRVFKSDIQANAAKDDAQTNKAVEWAVRRKVQFAGWQRAAADCNP